MKLIIWFGDSQLNQSKVNIGSLFPGCVLEKHFWLLIEFSGMHSEKVINALREHLVSGHCRKDVCEKYNVSQGYFSSALIRIQRLSQLISNMVCYYIPSGTESTEKMQ
ncbi:adhesin biosynthesis transcription regulatory family protein [Escherichia coli]|uniref:adhesin biosynthesis transcription regulatory family protein n=1 Tax=Escherichia coli TaxID=562 RepID=UPI000E200036|nr:adhesin biosynthesis transcription regulatory family protein [Escherichia coli]EHY5882434.1 adhesin biosynthesis transcription regulatory family protein [Escherichia coli]